MRYIADFHIHSKYARATSSAMEPETLALWAGIKGIQILGTGDFTHPVWLKELQEKLEPAEKGLFKIKKLNKNNFSQTKIRADRQITNFNEIINNKKSAIEKMRFILTAEIANIYFKDGKTRRMHNLIFAPSFEVAEKINFELSKIGNLHSDGRPILGLDSKELLKIVLNASERAILIPAHIWTPWFSIFGSKSGFDTIEECFDEYAKYIFSLETGLSSDPAMNWRLSALDGINLISNSDAHSPENIGREANIFEGEKIDYDLIMNALKKENSSKKKQALKFISTIEFFPEEGKYHYNGHRLCGISMNPNETRKNKNICPVCGKFLTAGVLNRIDELADRTNGVKPVGAKPFKNIIPLREIIAESVEVGKNSKMVQKEYLNLINQLGDEFSILLKVSIENIAQVSSWQIAEGVQKMREGKVNIIPGFDGEYGKIKIFNA